MSLRCCQIIYLQKHAKYSSFLFDDGKLMNRLRGNLKYSKKFNDKKKEYSQSWQQGWVFKTTLVALVTLGQWILREKESDNQLFPNCWFAYCVAESSRAKSWKEFIDEQDFRTEPDEVVLWTGAQAGNLIRADNYARANGRRKKILERTQAGDLLNRLNLFNPDWFKEYLSLSKNEQGESDSTNRLRSFGFQAIGNLNSFDEARKTYSNLSKDDQERADAIWRYASQKLANGITGHVVAFILSQDHPYYKAGSIYHHIEKPTLLKNPKVFLSKCAIASTGTIAEIK